MGFMSNQNVFEYLNKIDIDSLDDDFLFSNDLKVSKSKQNIVQEELDPSIDGDEVLYEDAEFSKTPNEADNYRSAAEKVFGFDLNGNQVQYLATEWPAFYHNAEKYASMKDQLLSFMNDEGLVTEDQLAIGKVNFDTIDDDIDYDEYNPDALHPVMNNFDNTQQDIQMPVGNSNGFQPLQVQSWDTQKINDVPQQNQLSTQPENEMIYDDADIDDDFSMMDPEEINKILMPAPKQENDLQ